MNDPVLSRLGLCRRAGMLSLGTEATKTSLLKRTAQLVVISEEISKKTVKEIKFANKNDVPVIIIPYSIFDITKAIGQKAGIVSVNDKGFANAIVNQLNLKPNEEENV